ncbi:acyl-CoA synthetase MbcS [Alkalihalobacillus sp. AL-G]|uniref:acyl-CoA synthetase MbcS n=1 Tax=Alkalihalobacillus sp. AL-G TaxID=2926399 RepID=UPI002729866F|nr:acyl--CoA ligase [Alkalihalobacillus sp. AL-G]WLD92381.1 acyl--CoA ligase [Alkalihalobacillus sp. AL-G]
MANETLIAPQQYNATQEMENFAKDPSRLAIRWRNEQGDEQQITYKEMFEKVNRLAESFLSLGLNKGDRVLVMMPRLIDTYIVYLANLKAGLVVIPCSEMLRPKDLSYRINHGEAKAVVAYHPYAPIVDEIEAPIPSLQYKISVGSETEGWTSLEKLLLKKDDTKEFPKTDRNDMAFLSYTSGTTGQPKGVVHTHGWVYAHIRTAAQSWLGIKENETVWATAGPGWQKWIWSPFVSVLGTGATGFVYQGKYDPNTYLDLLDQYKINVLCCTPTEYRLMAKVDNLTDYKLSHLRSAVSAGEPLNREVIDTFQKYFDVNVRDGYGQTENTLLVGIVEGMEIRPGSMGKPTPGNRVEIINDDGEIANVGEVGDIAVHKDAPALFREYFKDSDRTKMAFRGEYYLTGDKAKKDEDGYFWFEGRGDDIIISSGYTIGPFEVEDALVKHPSVRECAVVASPDEVRGNIVKAFVVLKNQVDAHSEQLIQDLQDHVKQLTAPYKYPRRIEFVDELPKTTSGKIRRIELRMKETQSTVN